MKKKIFLIALFAIALTYGYFFQQAKSKNTLSNLVLENIEALTQNESAGKGCSAVAYCYIGIIKSGEVSCTGTERCTSGKSYVECDGKKSSCSG